MLDNNTVQQAWIDHLQADASVLALSTGTFPTEIREQNYQGEKFVYPNIRVMCEVTGGECIDDAFTVLSCFSEQKSSKEAQAIAGTIATGLHNKSFTQNGIRISAIRAKTLRAVQENGVWKADVQINSKAI